jgi:carbonic anhydrase
MRISVVFSGLAVMAVCSTSTLAATWQPVAEANGERVAIDKGGILRTAKGKTTAWTRLELGRELSEKGIRYTAVQTMNRYDCAARNFSTVRRVYLLADKVVREELIDQPKEMLVRPGSVDEVLLIEACKPRTVGEAHKIAEAAAQAAAEPIEAKPMHADMRSAAKAEPATTMPVADAGQPEVKAEAEAKSKPRPRFIELPKIDKSKVEDPYAGMTPEQKAAAEQAEKASARPAGKDTAKAPESATPKPAEKAAAKVAEPAKGTVADRRELERQYATSGPRARRTRTAPRQPTEPAAPVYANLDWSYEGAGGPANWAKLRPDYAICAGGRHQSPIDIRDGIRVDLEPIKFDYALSRFRVIDTGHTIQVAVGAGSTIAVGGHTYQLLRLEFHRPAEEHVTGRGYDMDVQFIHQDEAGNTAVVVVLLEAGGTENAQIQMLWNNLPLEINRDVTPIVPIDLKALLPENRAYYTYIGSLTTPPCTEEVLWMVLKQPMPISVDQLAIFSHLYKNNARPLQPSNGRLIKENR